MHCIDFNSSLHEEYNLPYQDLSTSDLEGEENYNDIHDGDSHYESVDISIDPRAIMENFTNINSSPKKKKRNKNIIDYDVFANYDLVLDDPAFKYNYSKKLTIPTNRHGIFVYERKIICIDVQFVIEFIRISVIFVDII